jgi:hypothetical protein
MKIGDVYEVIPMFQITIESLGIISGGFYGRFIGYDSSGKCVFEVDGKYRGYWEAGTRDSIFDTAKMVPLTTEMDSAATNPKEYGGKVTFVKGWP